MGKLKAPAPVVCVFSDWPVASLRNVTAALATAAPFWSSTCPVTAPPVA
ncbi:MAG: hypothetical protein WKF30_13360 [Pyrinomonadaceae bacterium]